MKNVVCLVPARGGSKRVVGKNGRMLGGRYLFDWSLKMGLLGLGLDTYLSTEVEEWGEYANCFPRCRWIRRPPELCGDDVGDCEVIKHALGEVGEMKGGDLVVYLRPTTPFRDPAVVKLAIDFMLECNKWDCLRSVEEMGESVYKCFDFVGTEGHLFPAVRFGLDAIDVTDWPNQECPVTYKANGYVDIVRASWIRQGSLWGMYKYGFVTPRSIEIDTEEDWEYAVWHERRLSERNQLLE